MSDIARKRWHVSDDRLNELVRGPESDIGAMAAELRDLREISDGRCPVHSDQEHGKEAEGLRLGIEALCDAATRDGWQSVLVDDLRRLLDRVDARDSLAYLERRDRRKRDVGKPCTRCGAPAGELCVGCSECGG